MSEEPAIARQARWQHMARLIVIAVSVLTQHVHPTMMQETTVSISYRRVFPFLARATRALIAALVAALMATSAWADFPVRPITLLVPYSPGGAADSFARVLAQELGAQLKVSVIVENRPGASGTIGTAQVARAASDGHTLLYSATPYAINPHLFASLPYADTALQPLMLVTLIPNVLVVPTTSPWRDVQDLVAQARAQPGAINAGSGGSGTLQRMALELLQQKLQLDMVHVPYKSGGLAISGLMGSQIDTMFATITSAAPLAESGRLRALGVSARQRQPLLPEVPTLAETVIPDYEVYEWHGIFLPAGVPERVVDTLHAALVAALRTDALQKRFAQAGAQLVASTPAEFADFLAKENAQWAEVVRAGNIRLD